MQQQEIFLEGERLHLLPERAVWWPAQRALILSDLHWGKSAHFRKHGIPMPGGTQRQDAIRLADIIREHDAEQLIIAGDLFHSRHNSEVDDFRHWRSLHRALSIHFITGNHDILPEAFYSSLDFLTYRDGYETGPFYIAHDDERKPGKYTIHGHLHPGISLPGLGSKGQTLPAFCIGEKAMVLPAFGKFTGCKRMSPAGFESVFIVGESQVLRVK